jgi:hypothetical protein
MSQDAQEGLFNIFKGPKYYVFERSEAQVGVVVLNSGRIASRLNVILRLFSKDTRFTDLDEPLFVVNKSQFKPVAEALGIKQLPTWLR